jgi:RHS repeat-associated protein
MVALLSNDGTFYWNHPDHLGSGRKLTDSSGAVRYRGEFDPHGQTLLEVTSGGTGTYANSHKYTGYEREWSTNLDYAKARMFSHNRARFMQPDPLGLAAASLDYPQSLNLYSYVFNDPANFTDPTGLFLPAPRPIQDTGGPLISGGCYSVLLDGIDIGTFCPGTGGGGTGTGVTGGGGGGPNGEEVPTQPQNTRTQTDCERFVDQLVIIAKHAGETMPTHALAGRTMLHAAGRYVNGNAGVTGFKQKFTSGGQEGGVYLHVLGHAGATLVGNSYLGILPVPISIGEPFAHNGISVMTGYQLSEAAMAFDIWQRDHPTARHSREQALAEIQGDIAGRQVGNLMRLAMDGKMSLNNFRDHLNSLLCGS